MKKLIIYLLVLSNIFANCSLAKTPETLTEEQKLELRDLCFFLYSEIEEKNMTDEGDLAWFVESNDWGQLVAGERISIEMIQRRCSISIKNYELIMN